ncbi:MAG: hypothetical protein Q8O89_02140, partial [Nanoarchaeota archaeon]|nr:hypothetical protein [Nanoarchaeota archaeon]
MVKNKANNLRVIIGIFSVLVLALFIAACEEGGDQGQSSLTTFIGGPESLSFSFEKTTPTEVYDNKAYPFPISIQVENKGEYDVPKNKVRISLDGVDPVEFGKTTVSMKKNPSEDLIATK